MKTKIKRIDTGYGYLFELSYPRWTVWFETYQQAWRWKRRVYGKNV